MNNKYLKLILLLTVSIQAAPKFFNSLGSDMELFQQKDCKTYQTVTYLPEKIKKECRVFDIKVNNAFKVGYKLDPYIDIEISEKKSNKYLSLLRDLDKRKENILTLIYSEVQKARKQNNIKGYSQLIENDKIKLYSSDYAFMEKYKNIFFHNVRYISHMQHMKSLDEQRKNKPKERRIVKDQAQTITNTSSFSNHNTPNSLLKKENTRLNPYSNKCYKYFDDVAYRTKQFSRSTARQDWYSAYIHAKIMLDKCPIALKTCKELPRSGKKVDKTIYTTLEKICKSTKENFHKVETLYKLNR